MASPAPTIVHGLLLCGILIAPIIVFLVCSVCNSTRDTDQDQQQQADDDEAVQVASIAMALLDRVTYPRHCRSTASAQDSAAAAAVGSTTETAAGTTEDDCAICLGTFEDGDHCSIMPPCRHEFHRACIAGWLKAYNNTCPLCRAQLQWLAVAENMV